MSLDGDGFKEPIASFARTCDDAFTRLQRGCHQDALITALEEQHARFKLWASNLGVFIPSNGSLDYRLRSAATLADTFRQLLRLLGQVLNLLHGAQIATAPTLEGDSLAQEPTSARYTSSHSTASSSEDDDYLPDSSLRPGAALKMIETDIGGVIETLQRLSVLIRLWTISRRNPKVFNYVKKDSAALSEELERYTRSVIKIKFPQMDHELLNRLSMAACMRRRRLWYQHDHHKKLYLRTPNKTVPEDKPGKRPENHAHFVNKYFTPRPGTQPTSHDEPGISHISPTIPPTIDLTIREDQIPSPGAQPEPGPPRPKSVLQNSTLDFPARPTPVQGMKEVECPYCHIILSSNEFSDEDKWRRHLMLDLEVYVCVLPSCTDPPEMFDTAEKWIKHMLAPHQEQWTCGAASHKSNGPLVFDSESSFIQHLQQVHSKSYTPSQLPGLARAAMRTPAPFFSDCPFGDDFPPTGSLRDGNILFRNGVLQEHIVRHLKELGLLSIPPVVDSGEDKQTVLSARPEKAGSLRLSLLDDEDDVADVLQEATISDSSNRSFENNLIKFRRGIAEGLTKLPRVRSAETDEEKSVETNLLNLSKKSGQWYEQLSKLGFDLEETLDHALSGEWEWFFLGHFILQYGGVENDPILAPFVTRYKAAPILSVKSTEFKAVLERRLASRDTFPSPTMWRDQIMYFILPDRFSDGLEGQTPLFMPADAGCAIQSAQEAMLWREAGRRFVGGNIKGIKDKLGYLQNLGVTTLCLAPVFSQCRQDETYDGFGIQNFLDVEARFGTRDDLAELVKASHSLGMYVVLTIVLNNAGNVFEYEADRPGYSGGTYPVQGFRDASGKPTIAMRDDVPVPDPTHISGAVWPVELQYEGAFTRKGRISADRWDREPDYLEGDIFDSKTFRLRLTEGDSFQPSPALQVLCDVYKYWIAYTDVDGFDVDMVRFIGDGPTRYFTHSVAQFAYQVGKENFLISGRLSGSLDIEVGIEKFGLVACSGVPHLQKHLWTVPKGIENPRAFFDLPDSSTVIGQGRWVKVLDDLHQSWRPSTSRARYCSDDIGRRTVKCAIAFALCTSGIPGIYYGTEQGFDGSGGSHSYIREAMFGGRFGAFESRDRHFFDPSNPIYQAVSKLCQFRSQSLTLQRGRQHLREISGNGVDFGYPEKLGNARMLSIIAWSRIYDEEELICIISTDDEATQTAWVTIGDYAYDESRYVECVCSSDEGLEGKRLPIEKRNGKAVRLTADPGHYAIYRRV